jgi:hypothetical protein
MSTSVPHRDSVTFGKARAAPGKAKRKKRPRADQFSYDCLSRSGHLASGRPREDEIQACCLSIRLAAASGDDRSASVGAALSCPLPQSARDRLLGPLTPRVVSVLTVPNDPLVRDSA